MKCRYCAEEIKDEAIICRFCGARKDGESWIAPLPPSASLAPPARAGKTTIQVSAVFFILSALAELVSVTSAVPLAGGMRSGAAAIVYHLVFFALFAAMGVGLIIGKPWGFWTTIGATAFYTLERVVFLLDASAKKAYIAGATGDLSMYRDIISVDDLRPMVDLSVALFIACWWGFAIYLYFRRSYFGVGEHSASARQPGPQSPQSSVE